MKKNRLEKQREELANSLRNSSHVLGFRDAAEKFCSLVEGHKSNDKITFIKNCHKLLPELYFKALSLPDFEPTLESLPKHEIKHDEWQTLFDLLRETLGENDEYMDVFDPIHPAEDDPTRSILSDDLADIYRDLKNGLIYWDSDSKTKFEDAVWQWKFNFEIHWGSHLTGALRVIHNLVFDVFTDE